MAIFKTAAAGALFLVALSVSGPATVNGPMLSMSSANAGVALNQRDYYGCTFRLQEFRKEHQQKKYAAFARGRAFSITGMRGCGWTSNQRTQAIADRVAMEKCRKNAKNPDKCYVSDRTK
ncbi:hypothetical protein LC092_20920 [Stappia stellulata]|uniref:hypothetical protein n=1 Tax=Stappia TaxID=152161 RepID=UPI001CD216BA|nr:hypothetical protein [Stappia stellulata]MCA1244914.1 hypothetical protein [Stappia stellulata]